MLLHLRLREVCTGRSGLWWSSESLWWPSDIDWLCWAIQNAARKSPCDKLILTIPHEWISDDRTSSHFFWWTCQAILFKGSHIVRDFCVELQKNRSKLSQISYPIRFSMNQNSCRDLMDLSEGSFGSQPKTPEASTTSPMVLWPMPSPSSPPSQFPSPSKDDMMGGLVERLQDASTFTLV